MAGLRRHPLRISKRNATDAEVGVITQLIPSSRVKHAITARIRATSAGFVGRNDEMKLIWSATPTKPKGKFRATHQIVGDDDEEVSALFTLTGKGVVKVTMEIAGSQLEMDDTGVTVPPVIWYPGSKSPVICYPMKVPDHRPAAHGHRRKYVKLQCS